MCGAAGKYKTCILGWPNGWLTGCFVPSNKKKIQPAHVVISRSQGTVRRSRSHADAERAEIAKHWEIIKRLAR
jgi:hypothetical protein